MLLATVLTMTLSASALAATAAPAPGLAAPTDVRSARAPEPLSADTTRPIAFVDVTVVPMDRERLVPGQTVVVRGGRIVTIGAADVVGVPAGAVVVEGGGRYLMPGLVDMHIHLPPGSGDAGDAVWRQMRLLVANGVTTARSLSGPPGGLGVRERVESGSLLGPRLYVAGPSLNHRSTPTPEAARAAVLEQAEQGYDVLKTHGVDGPTYEAIVAVAGEVGLRLVGHVVPAFGLERAMEAGQQVEHLDGWLPALVPDDADVAVPSGQFFFGPELDAMREDRIPALAERARTAGIVNSPTLALFEVVAEGRGSAPYLDWPEARYASAEAREAWARQLDGMAAAPVPADRRARYLALRGEVVRALRDAGAALLAGSDSPQLFLVPGFGLHRELDALVRTGLSPYEALVAATRAPAEYIGDGQGGAAPIGVVAEGRVADLLLLDANPLDDVAAAREPAGVVLRGRWLPAAELRALKEAVAAAVAAADGGRGS